MNRIEQGPWHTSPPKPQPEYCGFVQRPSIQFDLPHTVSAKSKYAIVGTAAFFALLSSNTSAEGQRSFANFKSASQQTSPALLATPRNGKKNSNETISILLHEIRLISGLTWNQLAQIFRVSRRSIHIWASGGKLAPRNEIKLREIHEAVVSRKENRTEARKFLVEKYALTEANTEKATSTVSLNHSPVLEAIDTSMKHKIVRKKSQRRAVRKNA